MEKLEFNNNTEMVELATKLLFGDEPYPYGYVSHPEQGGRCLYRTEDGKRCIFGRLMVGRVPEDSRFWSCRLSAAMAMNEYPSIKKACPWIAAHVAEALQDAHDTMARTAGILGHAPENARNYAKRELEKARTLAVEADKEYFGSVHDLP